MARFPLVVAGLDVDALRESFDVVVAGAGFAGAATACALAAAGVRDVLVLEAEDQPGSHASGLNAALLRRLVPDPATGAALRRSARAMYDPAWNDAVGFERNGSMLLVGGDGGDLAGAVAEASSDGLACRSVSRDEAIARVPVLASATFDHALFTQDDAVVDIHALLWRYLAAARAGGAVIATACPITSVETDGTRVVAVSTPRGRVACRVLVDAAGAWANGLAALAGLPPLSMAPYRRHLVTTPPADFVDRSWPFVWDVAAGYYFRPEVGGLLMSPCDQSEAAPGPAMRDPAALVLLAEKLARHAPALAGLAVKHWWAGLRTITADGRFAIGWDPRLEGFFWVAGLGGHGMTGSAFAGEAAARLILGRDEPLAATVDPARLV